MSPFYNIVSAVCTKRTKIVQKILPMKCRTLFLGTPVEMEVLTLMREGGGEKKRERKIRERKRERERERERFEFEVTHFCI